MSLASTTTIEEERQRNGNSLCADCLISEPTFVSINFGVFLCLECSKVHKQLPCGMNNVVSLQSKLSPDQLNFIKSKGNQNLNKTFEKFLPVYYHRPEDEDPHILREQFIRAKYEREEFREVTKQKAYSHGTKEGILFKRGKGNDKFNQRRFVLKEPDGVLKYYVKPTDKTPKDTITIRNLVNVYIVPEKIKNNNGMQITYEKDGVRRNLFVFGIDGKTTTDWYHALRASMVKHKYKNFPEEQMKRYLNAKIIQEGWMNKTGPKRLEKFKRRWFTLVGNMIWYYTQPLDAHPLGYIPLGSRTFGYGVMKGLPQGIKSEGHNLTIHTPDRVYALLCFTMESRDKWVTCIEEVLNSCTSPWSQPSLGRLKSASPRLCKSYISNDYSTKPVFSSDSETYSSQDSSSTNTTPEFTKKNSRTATERNFYKHKAAKRKSARQIQSLIYKEIESNRGDCTKINGSAKNRSIKSHSQINSYDSEEVLPESESDDEYKETNSSHEQNINSSHEQIMDKNEESNYINVKLFIEPKPEDIQASNVTGGGCTKTQAISNLDSSSLRDSSSPDNVSKRPKKPPRRKLIRQGIKSLDLSSDKDSYLSSREMSPTVKSLCASSDKISNVSNAKLSAATNLPEKSASAQPLTSQDDDDVLSVFEPSRPPSVSRTEGDEVVLWRNKTFSSTIRRVAGNEHARTHSSNKRVASITNIASSPFTSDAKEIKPRPIDVTLYNQIKDGFWFVVFQSEANADATESFVTPWVGAQIAEAPASVGPIRVPCDFHIAVIDTSPGGFGLQRTIGPFPTAPGEVWEVEIPIDDSSIPEMYYHEGMLAENDCVTVYASVSNLKKFDIAVFKSGRKLLIRKNIKPGDVVHLKIKPVLHFLAIDQEAYFDMEGQDVRASDLLPLTHSIDINYRQQKCKVQAKRRGSNVFFTKL